MNTRIKLLFLSLALAGFASGQEDIKDKALITGSGIDRANDWFVVGDASTTGTNAVLKRLKFSELANVSGMYSTLEPALGNPGTNGYVLSSTTGGTRSWIAMTSDLTSGPVRSSSGVSTIADAALSIAKTSGLQTALDAKLPKASAPEHLRHVDHYGADPTGVADSTAAFTAAMAASGTAPIPLGKGTYLLPNGVPTFTKPSGMIGTGRDSTHIVVTSTTADGIGVSDLFGGGTMDGYPWQFAGFHLVGPGGDATTMTGINLRKSTGGYHVAVTLTKNVFVEGFRTGIHIEGAPQANLTDVFVASCYTGIRLTKADTFHLQGICIASYTNIGAAPAVTGANGATIAIKVDLTTADPPLSGQGNFAGIIENFEIGDVDAVLHCYGNQSVIMRSGNVERVGTFHQPETGADWMIKIEDSLGSYEFQNWRVAGIPTGTAGRSAYIRVHSTASTSAVPAIRISGFPGGGATYHGLLSTGAYRAYVLPTCDISSMVCRYNAALGDAADANSKTRVQPIRPGHILDGPLSLRETSSNSLRIVDGGTGYPGVTYQVGGVDKWNVNANGNMLQIWDIANNAQRMDISPSGVKIGAATTGTYIKAMRHGTATLTSGTATVSNTVLTDNARIFINRMTDGGTVGDSYSVVKTAGTGFTITSKTANATVTGDTSVVGWLIIEP